MEEGASIGAGAVVVAGARLGAWSMVAAGAVVTRSLGRFELVSGVPAAAWIGCAGVVRGSSRPAGAGECAADRTGSIAKRWSTRAVRRNSVGSVSRGDLGRGGG